MARRSSGGWRLLLVSLVLNGPSAAIDAACASAQAAPESSAREPADYRKLVGRAVREFDAGNYAEARALFTRAHGLYPSARTHLGLGLTEYELRNYGTSIEHLEQALASSVKPLNAQLRKSAEDVLGKARDLIGRVNLEVSPSPGRVLVDGVPVALSPGQALVLEVGDHTIEVQAAGYLSERRSLSILGGEQIKLSVVMRQPEAEGPAEDASEQAALPQSSAPVNDDRGGESSRRWYKSPWLWVSVGVLVAAGGVTAGLLLRPDPTVEAAEPVTSATTPPGGVFRSLGTW